MRGVENVCILEAVSSERTRHVQSTLSGRNSNYGRAMMVSCNVLGTIKYDFNTFSVTVTSLDGPVSTRFTLPSSTLARRFVLLTKTFPWLSDGPRLHRDETKTGGTKFDYRTLPPRLSVSSAGVPRRTYEIGRSVSVS